MTERLRTWFNDVAVGAAYGTSKAGIGIAGLGSFRPDLIMKVRSYLPFIKHAHATETCCNSP